MWLSKFTEFFGTFQFLIGVLFVSVVGYILSEYILPFDGAFYFVVLGISTVSAAAMVYFSIKMEKYLKNEPTSN